MASRGDKVFHRVINLEMLLQGCTANSLDVVLLKSALKELAGNSKLLVQHVWDLKNRVGTEVDQLPDGQIFEQGFWRALLAWCHLELVRNELELSFGDCPEETQRIEFEISCYDPQALGLISQTTGAERKREYVPTQMDSRFATVPPQVI